jgi:hypothetical protein
MSESEGIEEIQDLTETIRKKTERIYNFPTQVKILEAKLVLMQDWGEIRYFIIITYEIDKIEYKEKRKIYSNINDTISDILYNIKDFYERMHIVR